MLLTRLLTCEGGPFCKVKIFGNVLWFLALKSDTNDKTVDDKTVDKKYTTYQFLYSVLLISTAVSVTCCCPGTFQKTQSSDSHPAILPYLFGIIDDVATLFSSIHLLTRLLGLLILISCDFTVFPGIHELLLIFWFGDVCIEAAVRLFHLS